MQNRPVWFVGIHPGSAPVWGAIASPTRIFGVAPKQSFLSARISACGIRKGKFAIARRAHQRPRRARYAMRLAALLIFAPVVCFSQQPTPTPSPVEAEAEQVVVTATRFDIPLDLSPASVSVINSEDFEQKQIERVSDALRDVPGLSVVQTGTAGQLTSVFTRGLRSEHTQVLLDGIPINQGLQGAFNFADLTIDDIDRIEVVRGPQSILYGPRALAALSRFLPNKAQGRQERWSPPKADHMTPSANGARPAARSATSIIQSAQAASTQTTPAQTIITATLLRLPTLAGRRTNNCGSAACSLTRLATLEIQTRSSIHVPLITFLQSVG